MKVYMKFFQDTLCVGQEFVKHALQNSISGTYCGVEKRGKHPSYNKTSQKSIDIVREHILSFPFVESHYCCKHTQKKYIDDSTLN